MKKLILLLFIPLAINLNSCGALIETSNTYTDSDRWVGQAIPPSKVNLSYEGKLPSGRTFSLYGIMDDDDANFYYNLVWESRGWYLNADVDSGKLIWKANTTYSKPPQPGRLYVNLKKRIAVYFNPDKEYRTYKVKVDNPEEIDNPTPKVLPH